jgi:hypothetical protein
LDLPVKKLIQELIGAGNSKGLDSTLENLALLGSLAPFTQAQVAAATEALKAEAKALEEAAEKKKAAESPKKIVPAPATNSIIPNIPIADQDLIKALMTLAEHRAQADKKDDGAFEEVPIEEVQTKIKNTDAYRKRVPGSVLLSPILQSDSDEEL